MPKDDYYIELSKGMWDINDNRISELEEKIHIAENNRDVISLHWDKICELEKWNQNHLKFEHSAIADELLKHEREISELKQGMNIIENNLSGFDFEEYKILFFKQKQQEEVLREHLKTHLKVSQDQKNGRDKELIFIEFDEAIQKQLEKLDQKDSKTQKAWEFAERVIKEKDGEKTDLIEQDRSLKQTNESQRYELGNQADSKPSKNVLDALLMATDLDELLMKKEPTEKIKTTIEFIRDSIINDFNKNNNTDYILIKKVHLEKVYDKLRKHGCRIDQIYPLWRLIEDDVNETI